MNLMSLWSELGIWSRFGLAVVAAAIILAVAAWVLA